MRSIVAAALLSVVGAWPAMALNVPSPAGTSDPHIRRVAYNQLDRTVLVGEIGRQTTVTFAPNERIGRVVFGAP
jgi:type IV secretory pathway VirB9-like protein